MNEFLFITHGEHNPYFNIASEEYLLKRKKGFYIYLWINAPSVIVGVNQNTLKEVNLNYTQTNDIKVVRRMTGGGAVYHDLNNICYTVIAPFDNTVDNYRKFTAPVIEYLNSLGVKAEFSGRNDVVVDGKKISGNAQTVFNDRIMHHGTLLFNTDLTVLSSALNPNKFKLQSKGIDSIRARVTNIYDTLPVKMTAAEFIGGLSNYFRKTCKEYSFTQEDLQRINDLVEEKYSRYEWNVGRSPLGKFECERKFSFGVFKMNFDLENGALSNVEITGDFFSKKPIGEFCEKLNGIRFEKTLITKVISAITDYIENADGKEIADALFE